MPPGGRRRVCVVGSGGREHALAVALARSADVVVAPGNPGMTAGVVPSGQARVVPSGSAGLAAGAVTCTPSDPERVEADLWVIGPEAPLVDGLADRLRAAGRLVFGPGADGARLEGSKAWMKELLAGAGVPTAAHATFDQLGPAVRYLRGLPGPWVVKTDGLAAGKGVLVTWDLAEAEADAAAKLSGAAFGDAGRRVVIEEGLTGAELSVMAVCDGVRAVALAPARDHKRVGDGDTGPNTGGMGAYSPVPGAESDLVASVMDTCILPTLDALRRCGVDYRGVLYAGLMLTPAGPKVIEFNVRFGDPETQVVLPRWQGDVTAVLEAAAAGRLDTVPAPTFGPDAAVCVVLAAAGYPGPVRTGDLIDGLAEASCREGVQLAMAGVAGGTRLRTAGGRVLGVTGLGPDLSVARRRAYEAAACIRWPGQVLRTDIAAQAVPTPGAPAWP